MLSMLTLQDTPAKQGVSPDQPPAMAHTYMSKTKSQRGA